MNSALLQIQNVKKCYPSASGKVEALKGVSLDVLPQQILAICGPSGCGKSTLLHLMGALDFADEGEIHFEGQNLKKLKSAEIAQYRSSQVGFVFQFFNLFPTLTVFENVALPAQLQGKSEKEIKERVMDLLEQVGLVEKTKHFANELSGGQMQRTSIARALVNQPKILLADEPTGNLDSENSKQIYEIFAKLPDKQKSSVVIVSHDVQISSWVPQVIQMKDGMRIS